jgi:hypothetical protein
VSFWESNSALLRERYPGLLEEISGEAAPEELIIETAASGAPALRLRGLYVHSPRDPEREGRRLAESVTANGPGGPVILLGFGLGYAAEAAAELAPDRPLIIVEKHRSLLRLALELRDLGKLLARDQVVFVPGGSGEGIHSALALCEAREAAAPVLIRNRSLVSLDEEWYAAVESRVRAWAMRDDVNSATLRRFGKRWVRNLSRNMSAIRDLPGISRFAGLASGDFPGGSAAPLPVFLAAAGPSLDHAAPLLAHIRCRCVVVAVDTSLRFLQKHGVEADFTLVVDPQFWNSRHLDRCGGNSRLIIESAVYPPVARLPWKGVYLCGSLFPLGSFIEQRVDPKGTLGAGGSVATTAWDFARILGARDIWIAGLDLAFPELKTHFRGALFEDRSLSESGRRNPAETWLVRALRDGLPFPALSGAGGQVLTDRRLSLYAAWFESRFRQFPQVRSRRIFPAGLAIPGLEPAESGDLLALPERRGEIDRRIETACARIETDFFDPRAVRQRAEQYENAVSALLRGLEQIKTAAEKGAQTAEQAAGRNLSPGGQRQVLAVLDEITRTISESEVKEAAGFLFPPAAEMTDEHAGDPFLNFLESSARFYRSLAEAAAFNLDELLRYATYNAGKF